MLPFQPASLLTMNDFLDTATLMCAHSRMLGSEGDPSMGTLNRGSDVVALAGATGKVASTCVAENGAAVNQNDQHAGQQFIW